MHPVTSHLLRNLITQTVTPLQTEVVKWKKILGNVIREKVICTKSKLRVLLLEKLKHKNIGTAQVEHFLKKEKNESLKVQLRRSMMSVKVKNAYSCEEKKKRELCFGVPQN